MATSTKATMGTVATPERGASGETKVYVHDCTTGSVGLIYRPANSPEALEWAFSLCKTEADVDSMIDLADTLANAALIRVQTPAVKVDDKPLTPPAPAPVSTFDIMSLKGMHAGRIAQWMLTTWTENAMRFNCESYGIAKDKVPTLPVFLASLQAKHAELNGKGEKKAPAPVATVAQTVAAPVASKTATPAPVATGKTYATAGELKGPDVDALLAKYNITPETGRGAFMVNRGKAWAAYSAANKTAPSATLNPAVTVSQTVTAPKATFPAKGTLYVADGKGGFVLASDTDVLAAMEKMTGPVS